MPNATPQQLAQAWLEAGGDPNAATTAVAIALAEQGGDAFGINADSGGTQSAGAWQINSANWPNLEAAGVTTQPIDLTNLVTNANAAIYISGNGKDWNPWTTFKNGAYLRNISTAKAAVAQAIAQGGSASSDNGMGDLLTQIEGDLQAQGNAIVNLATGGGADAAWNQVQSLLADVQGAFSNVGNVFANIGPFAIGVALVLIGGVMLAFSFGEDIARTLEKAQNNPIVQGVEKAALL